jgi:hypothetical protein
MAVRTDNVQIKVDVIGNEAMAEIAKMEKEVAKLEKSMKGVAEGTQEHVRASQQLDQAKQKLSSYRKEVDLSKLSFKELDKYRRQLMREAKGINRDTKAFKDLQAELDRVNGEYREANDQIRGISKNTDNMVESFMELTPFGAHLHRLRGGLKGVQAGTRAASGGFKGLRAAIVSTGIGALVVLLGLLVNWLTTTQAGIDKVTRVTRPLQVIFQRLMGVLQELGGKVFKQLSAAIDDPIGAIKNLGKMIMDNLLNRLKAIPLAIQAIKKVFQGDFKEGFKDLGNSYIQGVTGIEDGIGKLNGAVKATGEFMSESVKQGQRLDDLNKQIERQEINIINNRDRMLAQVKRLNDTVEDTTRTEAERTAAAKEALRVQEDVMKMDQDLINLKIERMELEHSFNDTSRADEKELAELRAEGFRKDMEITEMRTTMRNKLNIIENQVAAERKKRHEARLRQQEEEQKKEEERLAREEELRKEAMERQMAGERALLELQISLMDEGIEKKIAIINQEYDRKLENLEGNEQQMQEQQILLQEQRLLAVHEAQREEQERLAAEDLEHEKLLLEEKFLNLSWTQQQYDDALFELEQNAMRRKLEAIKEIHGEESLEYQRQYNKLLALQKGHNDEKLENTRRTEDMRQQLQQQSYAFAADMFQLGIELIGDDEKARKKHAETLKNFERAKIFIAGVTEQQEIFKSYASLGPIGQALAVAQSIIAGIRTVAAMTKVSTTKFAKGGVFGGSRHSRGGNAVIDSNTGQQVAEVEAGEPWMILSRDTYANNRGIVDKLLYSSMFQGGRPIFETGGVMNPYRAPTQTATTGVASGGSAAPAASPAANPQLAVDQINEIRALRRDINKLMKRPVKAQLVYSEFEDVQQDVNDVRSDAQL